MNVYTSIEDGMKKQTMGRLHDALQTTVAGAVAGRETTQLRTVG